MGKLKVGVVFGGRSVEHDVSIVTAHQVMAALAPRHEVVPIYISKEGRWFTGKELNDLEVYRAKRWAKEGKETCIPPVPGVGLITRGWRGRDIELDVVVPAIHGTFGEDGTLQGVLEMADIPYVGSGVTGSAVGLDKAAMKSALRDAGLPTVADVLVEVERLDADPNAVLDSIENLIGYPCFVKPVKAGSSVGIAKATDCASLETAIDIARRYDRRLLVETSMEGCIEVNCSVVGGIGHEAKVSVCEQPVAWQEFLSFEDKYMRGGKASGTKSEGMAGQERRIPAPISDELTKQVQENALAAFRAVDASGVARIDAFVKEDTGETWVMEINTTPGSFSFYLWGATGVSFSDLLDELIEIALDTHRAKQDLMFTFESNLLQGSRGPKTDG